MWYINHAEPEADLICGFNRNVNKETYIQYLQKGRIKDILNHFKVNKGDVD